MNVSASYLVRNLGDSGNVAVMEVTGNHDAKNPDGSYNDLARKAVAKEYFKTHGDVDFLVYLSTFDYAMPESGAEGFYLGVRNDVQGINQPIFDNSAWFGSNSKLQGTIDLGNITNLAAAPYGALLETNVRLLNHDDPESAGAADSVDCNTSVDKACTEHSYGDTGGSGGTSPPSRMKVHRAKQSALDYVNA